MYITWFGTHYLLSNASVMEKTLLNWHYWPDRTCWRRRCGIPFHVHFFFFMRMYARDFFSVAPFGVQLFFGWMYMTKKYCKNIYVDL